MSDLLLKGLVTTKRELEAGLADAEAELARTEEYCRKLEELIAVGRATLHAATQVNFRSDQLGASAPTAATNGDQAVTDLQKRLAKEGSK
ncbi:MAG: hypothetical protein ACM3OO_00600 [Planctomycetaceae bacterium]